jgi:hypothetical protein
MSNAIQSSAIAMVKPPAAIAIRPVSSRARAPRP